MLSSKLNCSGITTANLVEITVTVVATITTAITSAVIEVIMLIINPQQDYYYLNLTSMDIQGENLDCTADIANRTSKHLCILYYTLFFPLQCVLDLS